MTQLKRKVWLFPTRLTGLTIGATALTIGTTSSPAHAEFVESVTNNLSRLQRLQALQEGARRAQAERILVDQVHSVESMPAVTEDHLESYPADGVYLYGERPVANQATTTYFVFESQSGSVTGAFYMPSSSFDCVQGQMSSTDIALQVTDSYSQETSAYALTLNAPASEIASRLSVSVPPNIEGFHALPVSESDRSILATCQAHL